MGVATAPEVALNAAFTGTSARVMCALTTTSVQRVSFPLGAFARLRWRILAERVAPRAPNAAGAKEIVTAIQMCLRIEVFPMLIVKHLGARMRRGREW